MAKSNVIPIPRRRRQQSPLTVYLHTLAPSGQRSIKSLLKTAIALIDPQATIESFDWSSLRYEDMVQIRYQLLNDGKSLHTVNTTLAALRGIVRTTFNMGLLDADTLLRVISIKSVKGESLPAGRALSKQEVSQLLKMSRKGKDLISIRNCAMLYLLIYTGVRRDELVNLKVSDYDPKNHTLVVRLGKGRRQRKIPLTKQVEDKLIKWMKMLSKCNTALFSRILKNNTISTKKLSTQSVYNVVVEYSMMAKIERCTPHDLRRTFITQKLQGGSDVIQVRKLAGHSDLHTTLLYDRR